MREIPNAFSPGGLEEVRLVQITRPPKPLTAPLPNDAKANRR